MGKGRDIADGGHLQTGHGQGANGRFPSGTRALDPDFHTAQTHVDGLLGRLVRRHGCGIGGVFPRPLEAGGSGRRPRDHIPVRIRKSDVGIVEGRFDMGDPVGVDNLLLLFPRFGLFFGCHLLTLSSQVLYVPFRRSAFSLSGSGRWFSSVDRSPGDRGDDANHGNYQYLSDV